MTYHFSAQMPATTRTPSSHVTSQMVNPAVLAKKESFQSLPMNLSTTPAYAASQPPTSQVVVHSITRKTDPHLGSNEYYSSGIPGVMILRRYNNIFIPQISPE